MRNTCLDATFLNVPVDTPLTFRYFATSPDSASGAHTFTTWTAGCSPFITVPEGIAFDSPEARAGLHVTLTLPIGKHALLVSAQHAAGKVGMARIPFRCRWIQDNRVNCP